MSRPDFLELPGPDDFHLHLRQGPGMADYARTVTRSCSRALIMPNTQPPIITPGALVAYRRDIERVAPGLKTFMTFKIIESLDPQTIPEFVTAGAVAGTQGRLRVR